MRKKRIAIGIAIGLLLILILTVLIGYLVSQRLSLQRFTVEKNLPSSVRVSHLSDLHFPNAGVDVNLIIDAVSEEKPDLIFLTGDIVDGKTTEENLTQVGDFFLKLRAVAPVFAVIGNHEIGSLLLQNYSAVCRENGVVLLNNEIQIVEVKNMPILVSGLKDGSIFSETNLPDYNVKLSKEKPALSLLLAHRPELLINYSEGSFDAVFTGHAHGGQLRIFNAGLYAPNQGFFPKFTSGRYSHNNTEMFVSRGLGDSISDFRCFNSYHLITVDFM